MAYSFGSGGAWELSVAIGMPSVVWQDYRGKGRPAPFSSALKMSLRDLDTVHKVGGITKTGRGDIAELLVVEHEPLAEDA